MGWKRGAALLLSGTAGCMASVFDLDLQPPGPPRIGDPARYACLSISDDSLRYMGREANVAEVEFTQVSSQCDWDVGLSEIAFESDFGSFSARSSFPITIAARALIDVPITYVPNAEYPADNGVAQLVFEGYVDERFQVKLKGDLVGPRAALDRPVLDFGEVMYDPMAGGGSWSYCESDLRYAHVTNSGFGTLEVGAIRISSDGLISPFAVAFVEAGGQVGADSGVIRLARGERVEIAVRYTPTEAMSQSGQLTIEHNGYRSVAVVDLIGAGIEPSLITESFRQTDHAMVDILWAIDSSGSMEEEHARLVANLSHFVEYADGLGADYQMAVIEAQELIEGAGVFRSCEPHPAIVHKNYADTNTRDVAFECMVNVGTNGFWTETAMGATRLALERAQYPADYPDPSFGPNPNAGFLRPDADLAVIAISDEDDQSSLPMPLLADALYAAKNHQRNLVKFHAIAGPPPTGCPYAEEARRYDRQVAETDGQFYEICEEDWRPLLQSLGLEVFRPRYQFPLRHPTTQSSIAVYVDGELVPPSGVSGFRYDEVRQLIVFTGAAVPPRGSRIDVRYVPQCPR